MPSFRFLFMLGLLSIGGLSYGYEGSSPTLDINQVIKVDIFALAVDSTGSFAEPELIRKNHNYHLSINVIGPDQQNIVHEILLWLNPSQLQPYTPGEDQVGNTDQKKVVQAIMSSMTLVVDFTMKDGTKRSYYGNLGYLFDETLSHRRAVGCEFIRRYMYMASYGYLSKFSLGIIDACKADKDRPRD